MHRLFEERAIEAPGALAVAADDGTLSYGELNARAEGLARHLRRLGIGPERLTAFLLERSAGLVVSAVATLKAGGAYLPIDPAQPAERVSYILRDSGADVLLTTARILDRFPGLSAPLGVVLLDQLSDESDEGLPARQVDPENLAYVIYTSGSTGAPKGAELRHAGLSNVVAWNRGYYGLGPGERVSMVAAPGFDASVWEMWPALTSGASLHLPSREVVLSPPAFLPWVAQEGITVAWLPAPLADAVLDEPLPAGLRLRVLQSGADRLLRRPAPGSPFELSNSYGPTETSIVSTAGPVSPDGDRLPHIGRPVANVSAVVLGADQEAVAEGAEGELFLGGVGLGRGYRHRPALTAEKFVPDPFGTEGGERLYRTGDLVRWLPSGDLEFLGRIDHQVKIRGYRVELGEIEAALLRHPEIREAAVLAREGRLVGSVALRPGSECDAEALRGFLARSLPDVMVPAAWIFLDALPLTPNGKVDRKALARLEPAAFTLSAMVAPRSPVEATVAGIWAEVLGLGAVGVEDDFFALGGHSLLASRVATRVREALGTDLGVRGIFDYPTVAAFAAWVERQEGGLAEAAPLSGIEISGPVPLSFAQQRLWFVERLRPGTAAFNLAQTVDLDGGLSVPTLAAAFDAVVRRHEALRTVFATGAEGEPVQIVDANPASRSPLPVVDLAGLADVPRSSAAERICRSETRRPYDLERGPLHRTTLLALGPVEHRLFVGLHHIVSDAWSIGVLMRELSTLYRGVDLPPLPMQYPGYSVWQRRRLTEDLMARRVAWWRAHLDGAPDVLELPGDRVRPAQPSFRGERLRLDLGSEMRDALAGWSRARGATLFMTLLAACQVLVQRFTDRDDFVLGSPAAGRDQAEFEGMIGFFVNMLPLRAKLVSDPTFGGLVAEVRETVLAAFAHQDLPFERLVEALAPERDASRAPLLQVAFALQDAPIGPDLGALGPRVAATAELDTGASELDCALFAEVGAPEVGGLVLIAEYATDLFDAGTVHRLLESFRTLLAGIAAEVGSGAQRRVSELPLLSAVDREQAISAWNRTAVAFSDLPVHRLFEEQVRRAPGRLALSAGDLSWTYGALGSRADALACRLRRLGAGPEVLVGLLLERSAELVVAAIATFKSGAAFLPVDPSWPTERVEHVLHDAGVCALVTTGGLLKRHSSIVRAVGRTVLLDEADEIAEADEAPVGSPVRPENLAYVIYTSGSTGAPKGVELCHLGLSNLVSWSVRRGALGAGDRVSMVAAPGFDASVWEMWPVLVAGGSLHLAPPEVVLSPPRFLPWAAAQGITVGWLPTPLAEAILDEPIPVDLRLRLLHTGGDRLVRRPSSDLPFELNNAYGPTECTVVVTAGLVAPEGNRPPQVGRPFDNVRVYILDRGLGLVPPGAPGELCIGGESLARGYRGRPDLTAERFVPDPFGAAGERLYRTGDRSRRLPSGDLEVLGRLDHQIKIRGHRIELGEIETALVALSAVSEAVVLVQEPEHRLVACVVPAAGAEVSGEALRAALAGSLPRVMIPTAWLFLKVLPLTSNGKVDRKALARLAPESSSPEGSAPRTPLEVEVAAIWAELLRLPSVGVLDDLFALGGHSLLAVRLVDRLRARLGVDMPLRQLFEAPTVAAMASWIEGELDRARSARAEPLLDGLAGPDAPLSFAQHRLWFLDRLEPGSVAYNLPILVRFDGPLEAGALAAALSEVVRRHEALRTTFEVPAGATDPVQVVHPAGVCALPAVELAGLPGSRRGAEAERLAEVEAGRPFDLRSGPLLRSLLLRLGPEEHRLLAAMHHIVSDGWSIGVLHSELVALYGAFSSGRPSPLPELAVQYPDFAVWQRRWLRGEELERQLAWWRRYLAHPPVCQLPLDRPRPAVWSDRGAVLELELPEALTLALERLGTSRGATPFMTQLSAFLVLLHRYTNQDDLVVGAPVAGRSRPDVSGLIGFFVNTLVLRVSLAGDPSFEQVLTRVREAALAAYAYQDLPFEKVVAELVPNRDLSIHPLFQVMLAIQDLPSDEVLDHGLTMTSGAVGRGTTTKFDLTLGVRVERGRTVFDAEHSTELFDATTIARFLRHLACLLAGIADAPQRPVSELPLLTLPESQQLVEWNDTSVDFAEGRGLHELVEAQVARTPERPAVIYDGRSLTYRELDRAANRLARRLRAAGVGPECVVGVFAERSFELVVGLLAVLKAGAAYLPLDPDYPPDRLAWMIADSRVTVVLADERLPGTLPGAAGGAGPLILPLGGAAADFGPDEPLMHRCAGPASLAYVIYTSGSTGRPKGAMLSHRGIVNHLLWLAAALPLGASDRVLQKTSFSFDASVWEFWAPLMAGAQLVLARPGEQRDPAALVRRVQEEGATVLQVVPALLGALLEAGLEECRTLRRVCCGGELLTVALAESFLRRLDADLVNFYGPTEAAVEVTAWTCGPDDRCGEVPIGRPVSNTRIHLVDRGIWPVPTGVHGELLIGGAQVGRGYLGRPELTAERFVPDPFSGDAGARLYRTGDLARRLADGVLDFLGRIDHQIKLRGLRIELGEIEAALCRHPGVAQAAVVLREGRIGAWYVPAESPGGGSPPSVTELAAALRGDLPEFMVPAWFEALAELPTTPNGKIDRRALAERVPAGVQRASRRAPGTPLEMAVAEIWSSLLEIEEIDASDDFFALGGHSLMTARLAARLSERLGVEMPLRAIFQEPTVARQAAWIEVELRRGPGDALALTQGLAGPASPLSFAQQRLWFLDRLEPGSHAYNMLLDLAWVGPLDPAVLALALAEVVRRHAALRTTFEVPSGSSEPVQSVRPAAGWKLPRIDLGAMFAAWREVEAARLARAEVCRAFDLERGPLLRTVLLRLEPAGHRLLATFHHIVADGLSMEILQRELGALYPAFSAGRPSPLPPLPVQYPDFAVWQRRWLSGEELERQLAWWRGCLSSAAPVLELPTDRPRPAVWSHRGGVESAALPADLVDRFERLGRRHGATAFMTLLGAFAVLLHRYTHQEVLVVGAPVAGRGRPEVAGLIGLFVNTLALPVSLEGDPPFDELLARVRETALAAYAHQDLPFEKLVAELVPKRDLSRTPLVQVVFAAHDAPEPVRGGDDVLIGVGEEVHSGTAKFDLSLHVGRSDGATGVWAEYGTDLFDPATIRRLLGHYHRLLEGIAGVGGDRLRVSDLPLLDTAEREQVLAAWNRTASEIQVEPVHRLFFEWAERTPEAIAIAWADGSLTYRELARRGRELANRLRHLGVGLESVVALSMERSHDLLTAALAVLEAGGAYLPIDPAWPEERRRFILENSGAVLLPELERGAPWGSEVRLGEIPPGALAYVIYTSGSTGRPKGTELCHRGLSGLIAWHRRAYELVPEDRTTLLASPGFDASVWESWAALTAGAAVYIPPREVVLAPAALLRWMADQRITVSFLPTPLAEAVLSEPLPAGLCLRVLLTGGDRLMRRPAPDLPFALVNHYGPTECTVVATAGRVEPAGAGAPDIGSPIANTRVFILDTRQQPVPLGVPGELCLAGEGLARGYRYRPELTAASFVPDPFGVGERLYRTGDLARRWLGGEIEFLGRLDHQVKIRGFRIELGEIEAVLGRHPGVSAAAVLVREGRIGAWYVPAELPAGGSTPTLEDLAAAMRRDLPEYMVPAWFEPLAALPLTASGKVDRRALGGMTPAALTLLSGRAPGTPVEEAVAAAWSELLGVEEVGATDDFFALGGHSLMAARLVAGLTDRLGVDLPLRAIFEEPTVAGQAAWIEAERGRAVKGDAPLLAAGLVGLAGPLSFAQQRLWFLDRLEPGSAAYNIPILLRFDGPLQVGFLAAALAEVVRRHEALRTTFEEPAGAADPVQMVHPPVVHALTAVDLSVLPAARRQAEEERVTDAEAGRPFDLRLGPLLRASLLRLGVEDHRLLATMHHIVSDGWSIDVLRAELAALYGAYSAGRPSPLAELSVQYPDFAVWQRRWLSGDELERQLAWWRRCLDHPPVCQLPLDRPRPAAWSYRGAVQELELPEALAPRLERLGTSRGATPFMTQLGAFLVLLHRTTHQDDLLVGTPVAGRGRPEVSGLIGFFVNTLVLRVSLAGDPSFEQVLVRVREATLAAYAHQDLPFEKLVAELVPGRDLSSNPLIQLMLSSQSLPADASLAGGLTMAMLPVGRGVTAKFDLTLGVRVERGAMVLGAEHSTALFDATTIARFLRHLARLIEGAAAAPERPVSELPLLSLAEAQQLVEWNDTAISFPAGLCLHELVEAQVERTPERPAVSYDGQSLTYRELDRAANRLAHRLRAAGAGPECAVGVLAERSIEMVVGLLAVLKAGAAYLPLDPDYPAERLALMTADSQVPVVLAEERLLGHLATSSEGGLRIVPLDGAEAGDDRRSELCAGTESLAYLIYTSGSTGRPKGTMVSHRAIVNHLRWMHAALPLGASDRVLQKTSFSFDASVWELWAPLVAGVELVLARPGEQRDPEALVRRVRESGTTVLQVVPALLGALLEAGLGECRTLRRICCGGEVLTVALAERLKRSLNAELVNFYGPTETAVEVVTWAYERDDRRVGVPLGRPVANTQIHLVDPRLRPVPVGVHGELLIGGAQVGRGYLGRPDLTADRFVPDPFSGEVGARLYRTGDLGRWLPDGVLDFLGRVDHQVKLRGLRIELGEIEAALCRHPGVSQAAVLVREERIGAWYVPAELPAGGATPSAEELAVALRVDLPEFMVPSWFEALAELPLTPNGKIDRRALEAKVPTSAARAPHRAPGTPKEIAVAEVWSELLGVESVGALDDFFALGGHSLMAARLAARLRDRLGVEMPLRVIFEEPTVALQAAWIEVELRRTDSVDVPALTAGLAGPASPLSFAQQRLWFLDRLEPGSNAYNMLLDLHFAGSLRPAVLALAIAEVVRRHAALRTTFEVPSGASEPVQVVRPAVGWTLPLADLEALDVGRRDAEAVRLAGAEVCRAFDLERLPLLRTVLLRLEPSGHRLLGALHHIVSDGQSMELLQGELGVLCQAFASGRPSPLPELPVQYPDFALWQRSWLSGEELERQLAWWRGCLPSQAPILELPTDRPRPAVWSHRGGIASAFLPADLAAGLERLGRRHGATPFMTLLGAFAALLHRYTHQENLVVGAPVAGRSRPEVAGLIGLFVNTLALPVSLAGNSLFQELLVRVRETALQAYAYQEFPFEKLVAELVPVRDLSRNPLVQVVFALHDAPEPVRGGADLVLRAGEGAHSGTAKFDLSLHALRSAEELGLWVEYATDLFDGTTVLRLLGSLGNLLRGICDQGERVPVQELPLLSAPERAQVAEEWSDTVTAYPRAATVHGLVEEQARRFPDRVALVGEALTYGELDLRAERLAARLRCLGVGPDHRVGLMAERSADLVAAMLGILKSGGAYLPLDPQSPAERLVGMLADAEVRVLVVAEGLLSSLPNLPAARPILLPLRKALSEGPVALERTPVDPDHLAYVMFTSGSTGRPKGVGVTHRNVVRLVRETDYARLDPSCVFLQFAPVPFDASTFEIWGPLVHGGRLALFPPGPPDLRRLGELIEQHGVTTMFMTTGLFHQMVESHLGRLRPLRQLLTGGDVLSPAHIRRAVDGLPGTEVIAVYGPTEGTTFTTYHPVHAEGGPERPVPIGRPIANARAHVLDRSLDPVPVGVAGQLYIGGDGLARGYLARPDLTAERFVPDPFEGNRGEPGTRLYATGDLARWRPDGVLEFLGRTDHQVKLRGFRIELGEIETALASHSEVESAVVVAREDLSGDKRLVAYVVPRSKSAPGSPDIAELRALVELRLPAYMMPSAFVLLSALPLTGNGKIDRRALPEPATFETTGRASTAPRTPLEEEVAEVWRGVLGVERVGIEDTFWELGGHSLLATQVLVRVEAAFGVELPLQTLFTSPTLAGFASVLAESVLAGQDEAEAAESLAALEGMSEEEVRALLEQMACELQEMA